MGKTLDDLPLDDAPLRGPEPDASARELLDDIDELIGLDDYVWALDTLEGIRDTVTRLGTATGGQRQAIDNIRAARRRQDDGPRRPSRRYEGWSR